MRRTFLVLITCALAACGDDDGGPHTPQDLDAGEITTPDAHVVSDAGVTDADVAPPNQPFVCDVVAPTACPDPAPKFADVQPIFKTQCGVCHGQDWTGEWPLDNYSHISDWQDEIRSELVSCAMPPPDSGVRIPLENRMKILNWLRCGLPR